VNAGRPLLTAQVHARLQAAQRDGRDFVECSLDLGRSKTRVTIGGAAWCRDGEEFPYLDECRDRTVYHWTGGAFEPVARYGAALVKLVPTDWGPPTFEIDGIKMLPTAQVSPCEDAVRKVALVRPRGKAVLDTCGGLGYFAACCLQGAAARVLSFEKNADVLWLRRINPWSPGEDPRLSLLEADVAARIGGLADAAFGAILHDPPRFAIAGELYSQAFYAQLWRVLARGGRLFHYTGAPNSRARGRDLAAEVVRRLGRAGFAAERAGDGVLAVKR
jgi:hypothetical protein